MFKLKKRLLDELPEDGTPGGGQAQEEEVEIDTVSEEVQSVWDSLAEDDDFVEGDLNNDEVEQEVTPEASDDESQKPGDLKDEDKDKQPVETVEKEGPEKEEVAEQEVETETKQDEPPKQTDEERLEAQRKDIAEKRTAARNTLVEHFKLSEEQSTKLLTKPEEVLPGILADMYLDVYDSVMRGMAQQMPSMVQSVQYDAQAREEGKKIFYDAWPKLDPVKHGEVVGRYAAMYSQMHPNATPEEIIRDVGAQVMFALKIPVENQDTTTQEHEEEVANRGAGFKPAGSSPARGTPAQSDNIFVQMAEEELFDD